MKNLGRLKNGCWPYLLVLEHPQDCSLAQLQQVACVHQALGSLLPGWRQVAVAGSDDLFVFHHFLDCERKVLRQVQEAVERMVPQGVVLCGPYRLDGRVGDLTYVRRHERAVREASSTYG